MQRPKRPVPGQKFPRNFFPEFYDFVMSLVPHSDRKTMRISWTRHGVQYSAIAKDGGGAGGVGGGGDYTGPFAVVRASDTSLTVKAYDGANYIAHNEIIAGRKKTTISSDQTKTAISSSGVLYLHITYNDTSNAYEYSLEFDTALPAQTQGNYYAALAEIIYSDSAIQQIQQIQYGYINIAGRVV